MVLVRKVRSVAELGFDEDEFIGCRWVNSDRIVKVLLGGTHLDRHSNTLHHLVYAFADTMGA